MEYRLYVSFQEQEFVLTFYDYQGPLGMSNLTNNNQVSAINLTDITGTGAQNITFTKVVCFSRL